ncbi:TetR/AcrR family transcriptional regulator [Leptospira sp. GIMC2001]|uniref:TetR/AcrR family transcriptional regulator n=1 Tax=Leptospira sp. GIMC2001 TaxID=1513297 RepID=UPI00234BECCB|nr:TetR/AcrR family transcriptional regulator [Leptospira sp. GIMC2001]WCL50579.1 TetR/AcrR family transcriptional regulator [Leptospira sp. GIMC2001]
MGSKGISTKQKMIEATAISLEENGYLATGINEIVQMADIPKGSLYFHFPGGKEELASLALKHSGREFSALFQKILVTSSSPMDATRRIFQALEKRIVDSDFKKGCPIVISALESMQTESKVQSVCKSIYNEWIIGFENYFISQGYTKNQGHDLSVSLFALWEGGLLLAKLQKSNIALRSVLKIAENLISTFPKDNKAK